MPQIDWTDNLNVDLPMIDEQHKKLISLSNGLLQAMVNGMGQDVLEDTFKELRDYTCYHFDDEEKYMQEIGYPHIDAQRAAHKKLTQDVDAFHDRLLNDNVSPNDVLDFINGWIINHITQMDSKIAEFVKNQ